MLAEVVGGAALTILLDPVEHPAKAPANASNMHAPLRA